MLFTMLFSSEIKKGVLMKSYMFLMSMIFLSTIHCSDNVTKNKKVNFPS